MSPPVNNSGNKIGVIDCPDKLLEVGDTSKLNRWPG